MDGLVQYSDSDESDHEGDQQKADESPPPRPGAPAPAAAAPPPAAALKLPSANALLAGDDTPMLLSPSTGAKRTATTSLTTNKPPSKVQRAAKQPTGNAAMLPPQLKGRCVAIEVGGMWVDVLGVQQRGTLHRSNVVTEDLGRLFTQRRSASQQPSQDPPPENE